MISSDVMRGFNSLILLSILMKEDSYGYQISNTIKVLTDGKYIMKETTLYSAFNRLEKVNLLNLIQVLKPMANLGPTTE